MSFVVYRSSAGSGKTYTLVMEYLKLALTTPKPDYYKQILAITFTNKAAEEMKERVLKMLEEIATAESDHELRSKIAEALGLEENEVKKRAQTVLSSILHNYSDFNISTIDKFVHRIIRTFAFDMRLPVNFEVELESNKLLTQAVDLLIGQVGRDEKLTKALVEFTEAKSDEDKSWHIENDLVSLSQILLEEEGQLNIEKLRELELDDFFRIRQELVNYIKKFENQLISEGKKAVQLLAENGLSDKAFYYSSKGIAGYFKRIAKGDLSKLEGNSYTHKTIYEDKWTAGKTSEADAAAIEVIKDELRSAYLTIQSIVERENPRYQLYLLIFKNIYALSVLNELEKVVDEIKQQNSIVHISEFNRLISGIVMQEPAPFIYERIGQRFRHYLIDEFQDTSVMQWQNLLPLVDESLSREAFNMVVGDGKQAIYRWRGGEVEQFSSLPKVHLTPALQHKYQRDDEAFFFDQLISERQASLERNYEDKNLGKNYRSKREIVEFNNRFFTHVAEHLVEGHQRIYEDHKQQAKANSEGGLVQLEFYEKENFDELNHARVLELIAQLQADGFRLEDIAILTRTNQQGSSLARFLLEEGIDVVSSESLLLSSSRKVAYLVALLRFFNDPKNKIAAAEVLEYYTVLNDEDSSSLHIKLQQLNERSPMEAVQKILSEYLDDLNAEELLKLPLYEVFERLSHTFLHPQPDPYLQFFMDTVLEYSARYNNNADDFLEWWETYKNKLSIIVPEGLDAVKILTIHKAKGLEFPVVIYPFAVDSVNHRNKNIWLDLQEPGLEKMEKALVPFNQSLEQTEYADYYVLEDQKSKLDVYNLLYVAMTRPVQRMYVLTQMPKADQLKPTRTADLFLGFVKSQGLWNDDKMIYTFGELSAPEQSESKENLTYSMDQFISNEWRERITISRKSRQSWLESKTEKAEKVKYGNLMHTALEYINTEEDIEIAVKALIDEGLLEKKSAADFTGKLNALLVKPEINSFFKKGLKVKNEADILLSDGTWLRPDRVVIDGKSIKVVDYKTGEEQEIHTQQLEQYEQALKEMGFENVEKYIIYTEEERLVRV